MILRFVLLSCFSIWFLFYFFFSADIIVETPPPNFIVSVTVKDCKTTQRRHLSETWVRNLSKLLIQTAVTSQVAKDHQYTWNCQTFRARLQAKLPSLARQVIAKRVNWRTHYSVLSESQPLIKLPSLSIKSTLPHNDSTQQLSKTTSLSLSVTPSLSLSSFFIWD